MLLHQRRYVEAASERVGPALFTDYVYRALFTELTASDPDVPVDTLAESLDDEATGVLQELLDENGGIDHAEQMITGSINALLSREISGRMSEIDRLMPLASSDEKDDLMREKKRLAIEIKALGRPPWKSFNSARS
jgi:alpha-D-ribose 1-methylphosphonate 5-triphosphate synthase subunit PhnI